MSKKKRTKQQKIIAKLKRQIAKQKAPALKIESKTIKKLNQIPNRKPATLKYRNDRNTEKLAFAYDPKLIKKDLIKTLLLSFIFLGVIFILKFSRLEELLFH